MSDVFGGGYQDYVEPDWWYGNEPESWWYQDFYIPGFNDRGFVDTNITVESWFNELVNNDAEDFYNKYGLSHYDVIFTLRDAGYWHEDDWETFGDNYIG